ncbi:hypothetical protein SNEBB_002994 [Seison nebaliae]|nr:hypothetical protein SNEBB_002994 [Seison nebaliae]
MNSASPHPAKTKKGTTIHLDSYVLKSSFYTTKPSTICTLPKDTVNEPFLQNFIKTPSMNRRFSLLSFNELDETSCDQTEMIEKDKFSSINSSEKSKQRPTKRRYSIANVNNQLNVNETNLTYYGSRKKRPLPMISDINE